MFQLPDDLAKHGAEGMMGDGLAEPGGVQQIARFHSLNKKVPSSLTEIFILYSSPATQGHVLCSMALHGSRPQLEEERWCDKAAIWQN